MSRAEPRLRSTLAALAEAMFPESESGAPDWRQTDMVRRTLRYLGALPPSSRRLLFLLFWAVEWCTPFLVPALRPFSRLSLDRRTRVLRRWRASRWPWERTIGDALKATLTMVYMSHPKTIAFIGMHSACGRPQDELVVSYRPGILEQGKHREGAL